MPNTIRIEHGAFTVIYTPYNKVAIWYKGLGMPEAELYKTLGMSECSDLMKSLQDFLFEFESRAARGILPKPD